VEGIEFTAHNIRLDGGELTKPDVGYDMADAPRFLSAKRVLDLAFPGDKRGHSILDLGCLEGGYSVEFARLGFRAVGLEVRASSIAACRWVQSRVGLPNLSFVQDDAWNAERHGPFDAVFCCGLLYHLDRPRTFIHMLGRVATRVVIIQTHFATEKPHNKFGLSGMTEHDGAAGRWFGEPVADLDLTAKEASRWASWDNTRSFWLTRQWLLQALNEAGFDVVFEQFDTLAPKIVDSMNVGYYQQEDRGTFVGIRTRQLHS
jgi:SAM-dependent methyltransferase